MKILIINGPNLNMLGKREPEIYGYETLDSINGWLVASYPTDNLEFFQSNHEGDIIDKLQSADVDGVVINGGGYTHTSIAIHDAIASRSGLPVVEVHLSDPKTRESYRHISYLESVCVKTYAGFGKYSYSKGIDFLRSNYDKI